VRIVEKIRNQLGKLVESEKVNQEACEIILDFLELVHKNEHRIEMVGRLDLSREVPKRPHGLLGELYRDFREFLFRRLLSKERYKQLEPTLNLYRLLSLFIHPAG
jgi:hypothetical protein